MKSIKYFLSSIFLLVTILVVMVYTWDIPAPTKTITQYIDINDEVAK